MAWQIIIVLVLGGLLLLMPLMTYLASRRMLGKTVADARFGGDNQLLYFYSKHCAPCRGMTPIIDALAQQHANVHKIDIAEDPQTARAYGVKATPTTLLVHRHLVKEVVLGARTRKQLEKLLSENH
jgi:thioredoxin 1